MTTAGFSNCFYVLGTGLGWAGLAWANQIFANGFDLGRAGLGWLGWAGLDFPTAFVFWELGVVFSITYVRGFPTAFVFWELCWATMGCLPGGFCLVLGVVAGAGVCKLGAGRLPGAALGG